VIGVWTLFGLRLSRGVMPLLTLLAAFVLGGLIAMTQMERLYQTPLYLAVTLFLGLTSVFLATVIERRPDLMRVIFSAWIMAGVVTAAAGIAGYFGLFPGAGIFTRYGRATGVFEDPNVFGPFLVLPAIFLLHRILVGGPADVLRSGVPLLVILTGLFLSFSRGAWGLFAFCGLALVVALMLANPSGRFRLRVTILAAIAVAAIALFVIAILQIPEVADLFTRRAQLVQDYDSARHGRFARFGIGFAMAMETPLGIGALQFGRIFGEDTHNIWLKALMDYSWLGFAAFLTLVVWTLAAGLRILFRKRPWQPFLLCAYIVFLGHILLATVIDIDHWRHFFLLIGIVWGGILLERRQQISLARFPVDRGGELPIVRAGSERSAAR
jgi:O-antigen ligase